ncbi:hypothetical protein MML48_5g00004084 [Holotrichia oblita]|nr:hypothetical protein MML48_5g00006564 [Holotrichia oblita]KAI4461503.1 hypothetical protein MML48_5g00004084 [Holotrichia oblita]
MVKASDTGGVMPMDLVGRLGRERERLTTMTDAERTFRKEYLKAQELPANEPRFVPELYRETYNPIRRAYRFPLDAFGKVIEPVVGQQQAKNIRYFTGKLLMFVAFSYACTYYFKYNENTWLAKMGWRRVEGRVAVVEGDPQYPKPSERLHGADYASKDFNNLKLNL